MKVAQRIWNRGAWRPLDGNGDDEVSAPADMVLGSGAKSLLPTISIATPIEL